MKPRLHIAVALVVAGATMAVAYSIDRSGGARAQPEPGFVVVAIYPHDPSAFTEGLAFRKGRLFEGTGSDDSSLRRVDLQTGEVKRQVTLADRYFGEGITVLGDRIWQLTYTTEKGWIYRAHSFERIRAFTYQDEGWGLTDDGKRLMMSNGTDVIRFRNPETFKVTRSIHVTQDGAPVDNLNELEWVDGEIFANVFPGDDIVRIDAETGEVLGRLSLAILHEEEAAECSPEVANGIAYMPASRRLFVTGKCWCHLYEIEPTEPSPSSSSSAVH